LKLTLMGSNIEALSLEIIVVSDKVDKMSQFNDIDFNSFLFSTGSIHSLIIISSRIEEIRKKKNGCC
jgi:hypothetical protein